MWQHKEGLHTLYMQKKTVEIYNTRSCGRCRRAT